jgi:hypothetical protein
MPKAPCTSSSRLTSEAALFEIDYEKACYRSLSSHRVGYRMSYLKNRLDGLPVAVVIMAIYIALPDSFRQRWGDASFTVLMCLGITLSVSPKTFFRGSIPALGKRKRRNLVVNWAGLVASTAVAAAYSQHESAKGLMVLLRRGRYLPRAIVLGPLVFGITYLVLWATYRVVTSPDRQLPRENDSER